jgi:hypothetical protein
MGYVSIANKLVALLEEITDFSVVYDHDVPQLAGFPAATVQAASHQNTFHDTAANSRTYTFLIRLFYRLDVDQDAETILRDLADQVIAKLEQNVTVAGVWEIAQPTSGVFVKDKREVDVQIVELSVAIRSRVLR